MTKQFCSEFNRVPRTMKELDRWKAVEFRSFLLYSGIVVLKNILDNVRYNHFCKLHIAIRILCDENICYKHNEFAEQLLKEYVSQMSELYGQECITYNCHSLTHINNDVLLYGPLQNFSAFKYENFLYHLKRKVKNGNNILSQISNRIIEHSRCFSSTKKTDTNPVLKGKINDQFYKIVQTEKYKLAIYYPDNFVSTQEDIFKILSINKTATDICLVCVAINGLKNFHNIDSDLSKQIGIFKAEKEEYSDHTVTIPISCIAKKYIQFTLDPIIVYIPLIE